jgi:TolB-like protein/class 3 adenylate cyclase/Tfp pilus assembly protein PilF
MEHQRRLAAILFTDIVGYTAMMQKDEQTAVTVNRRYVSVLKQSVLSHGGEILNDYGDGSLCSFPSATEAMRSAIDIQQQLQMEPKVPLRIGLHVGEIFFEDGKVFGDGVNVASRIQSLGIANSILFSSEINTQLKNQQEFKRVLVGRFHFKNVDEPMEVFAVANKGLIVPKKEEMAGKLKEIQKKSISRKMILIGVGAIILVAAFFIYQNLFMQKGFASGDKTIAVLPFENIGTDSTEDYLSDGITQGIIQSLSKISSLKKVIGWFSVRVFKKTPKTLNEIAKELGVTAILSGTIRKQGDKTRIITELIEVNTNNRLWGADFEYDSKDILSIQSKISGQIVNALKTSITPEEMKALFKQYTDNPEAYKLYRKGRFFWDKRNRAGFDSAEAYYKRAIQLDPDFALAYVGLADCYTINEQGLSQLEAMPIARDYVNKALALDSNLSEALTTCAFILNVFEHDRVTARTLNEKARKIDPNNPIAHLYFGNYLILAEGKNDSGIAETKKALQLDPLSLYINYILGRNYYHTNQLDSAYRQLKKTLILNPGFLFAKATLAHVLLAKKDYAEAFKVIRELPKTGPVNLQEYQGTLLSYAYAVSGDLSRAKIEMENTIKENPRQLSYYFARNYGILKDYDQALTLLEKSYNMRELPILFIKVDRTLDPLRSEPRFKAILKKMHLESKENLY